MKLLQANIWGGRLNNQLNGFMKDQDADIVCFQEVVSTKGDGFIFETLEHVAEECGYENSFFSPVFTINLMQKKAGFGNAILSRHDIAEQHTVFTRLEHKEDFDFDLDDYNVRNFQHAVINAGGKKLNVLNHHGHHVRQHKNGDEETMRQCRIIADYISGLEGPVILTGDFNLAPHSESLEQINKLLVNLSVKHKLKTTRTQLTHKSEVCDYIFVSRDIKVNNFHASEELVSDHMALILDFEL